MATATIYSSAADSNYFGYGTYSTARETQYAAINDGTTSWIGQATWGASDNECDEFVCVFDLSGIAAGQTVSNASMGICVSGDSSTTDFTLEARAVASNAWVAGSQLSSKTLLASISTTSIGTGAKTLTSEAALAAAIEAALGGTLYVHLSSSRQRTGTAPSGNEYIEIFTGNYSTESYRPKLTFDYETATSGISIPVAMCHYRRLRG
jgi:hypothetical protein